MGISPEQWQRVKELYGAAVERSLSERQTFLYENEADETIRAEVLRLLTGNEDLNSFLSKPPFIEGGLPGPQAQRLFAIGDILAERFRINSFIAAGGMGEVYEAEDLVLKEKLAVKTIRPEVLQQRNALSRFKREVQLARKVTHPNVCRVFDLFWHRSTKSETENVIVCVSMELLQGETLSQYIRHSGRLTASEARLVIDQVAAGLDAAHRAGVVHRDLKPGNVMLVRNPEQEHIRAVITDFGLALRTGANATDSIDLTASHALFGTPAYMAPEQIAGNEVTKQADIYAFGLIVYEILTGQQAFPANTPLVSAAKRLSDSRVSLKQLPPEVRNWEYTIERCLQRDPNARFSSALDVAKSLGMKNRTAKITRGRRLTSILALIAAIAVVSGAAYLLRGRPTKGAEPSKTFSSNAMAGNPLRLAVLPFHNVSSSPAAETLSDDVAEDLIATLGQAHRDSLRVLAKSSCLRYRETAKAPAEIAKELGVQYLVAGSVKIAEDKTEMEVQLVNGTDQTVVWAKKYIGQVSQLQSEVADSVAREVQVSLLPESAIVSQAGGTSNPLAHEAYLRGKLQVERKNPESFHRALQELRDATVLDPKYALAYAGISEVYINLAYNEPAGPSYAYAKQAAATAIRLDENVAEAHRNLAWILDNNDFDWSGAEREYRRALELNPSDSRAHHWYAQHLAALGEKKQAVREARLGLELDPLSEGSNYNFAFILIVDGQFDTAIDHLKTELAREPNSEVVNGFLGLAYLYRRDYETSVRWFRRTVQASNSSPQYQAALASALARAGNTSEAQQIANQLRRKLDRGDWVPAYNLAVMYFALGNKNEGYRFLRAALTQRSCTLLEINTDHTFLALKGEERFEAIRREFHLPAPVED